MIESVVAHEVGHQWFYNVVGSDQINEPWLDEAVDQYVTGLYFLDAYGKSGYDGYRSTWQSRWERVSRANIPIGMPAEKYQGKEYGAIVYGRGRCSSKRWPKRWASHVRQIPARLLPVQPVGNWRYRHVRPVGRKALPMRFDRAF